MDSNDRERVEEARAELKKMVKLLMKKKEMKIIQLHVHNDADIEWSS